MVEEFPEITLTLVPVLIYLGIGLLAGVASGLAGIGGNIVIVPLLALVLFYSQKFAQGLSVEP